jgi:peroxiredoxin
MALEVGQTAPHFSLFDTEKTKVTLAELKGHLYFFYFSHWPLPLPVLLSYVL